MTHHILPGGTPMAGKRSTPFGEVPEHWTIMELERCAIVQTGVAKGRKLHGGRTVELPYLRVANVQDGYLDLSEMKHIELRELEVEQYTLRPGDVVVTEGGDFDKLGRGFVWDGQIPTCVHQNHIFAIRANRSLLMSEYLAYLIQSRYGKSYFLSVAHKTTNLASINSTKLKAFPVPLPSLSEQQAIAQTMKTVQDVIQVRRHEAGLERERKAALMQHLFTYGTRGEPTKQAEIGEIPASWQVVHLRDVCTIVRGSSPRPKGDPRYYGGNVPRLMIADVTRDGMYVTPQIDFLTEAGAALSRPMKKGDLVLSISGTVVGFPCILAVDACIHDGLVGLKSLSAKIAREYLYFQILFWRERLNVIAPMGSIFKNLTTDIVKDFPIFLPDLDEQHEIASILLDCEHKLKALEQETSLLEELFRALLEDLMAGRLSVASIIEVEVAP